MVEMRAAECEAVSWPVTSYDCLWLSLSLFLCVCRHLESPASLEKSSDIFFAVNEATLFHVCLFFLVYPN
jgi:hypothetical protein